MGDGSVGSMIVLEILSHDPRQTVFAARRNSDTAMDGRGPQIDQKTFGFEDSVSFAEGIDHALVGHSSQGPGENDSTEFSVAVGEQLGTARFETDNFREPFWQRRACLAD